MAQSGRGRGWTKAVWKGWNESHSLCPEVQILFRVNACYLWSRISVRERFSRCGGTRVWKLSGRARGTRLCTSPFHDKDNRTISGRNVHKNSRSRETAPKYEFRLLTAMNVIAEITMKTYYWTNTAITDDLTTAERKRLSCKFRLLLILRQKNRFKLRSILQQ